MSNVIGLSLYLYSRRPAALKCLSAIAIPGVHRKIPTNEVLKTIKASRHQWLKGFLFAAYSGPRKKFKNRTNELMKTGKTTYGQRLTPGAFPPPLRSPRP